MLHRLLNEFGKVFDEVQLDKFIEILLRGGINSNGFSILNKSVLICTTINPIYTRIGNESARRMYSVTTVIHNVKRDGFKTKEVREYTIAEKRNNNVIE